MNDVDRLVEQARDLLDDDSMWSGTSAFMHDLLAGLADAVESIRHDLDVTEEANENLRRMLLEVKERDEARDRVTELESGLRSIDRLAREGGMKISVARPNHRTILWLTAALLDGRVPSTGQETDGV